jgi:uncharacterized membrane protein YeaQ/YmgE (transglycosylase-associated protein family)
MAIFGFLTIGALIGWLSYTFTGEHGIKLLPSIIIGVIGVLTGGSLVLLFDLLGSGIYAGITSIVTLFTFNAFRKKKPIFANSEN